MSRLRLILLGGFEIRPAPARGRPPLGRKPRALLACLALSSRRPPTRQWLAGLLWGDRREARARESLRQALTTLRRTLPQTRPPWLLTAGGTLGLNPAAVEVDVAEFERLVAADSTAALEQAAALYRGHLLDDLHVDEPPFEDWLRGNRERLRELATGALKRLVARHEKAGALARAADAAGRLLALDATQEPVHRALMRLQLALGRRADALRQYQHCVTALQRALGIEPEAETKALYQEILRQRPARGSTTSVAAGVAEVPLVGRHAELIQAHQALTEAWTGRGRVLAVVGEAGIGKSRFLAELAAEAGRRAGATLLGRAYESEQILPFGPWVAALRDGAVLGRKGVLDGLERPWRVELARLFPELGGARRPTAVDPGDRLRLFDALAHLLRRVALDRPLVVLLEDCHWADEMTLRFLAFFGRRLGTAPILVAASAREEELTESPVLEGTLAELAAEGRLDRLALPRLPRDDTLTLVRLLGRVGGRAAAAARRGEQVWATSAGNPFIVVETMRAIRDGVTISPAGGLPLPGRVREMIARRLDRLSAGARQLVSVASVIGREFEFTLLQRAAGLEEREAAERVEELVRRRVLHGVGDRFDFAHERIRDVAVADLLPPRRRWLHARVATALEELAGGDLSTHWAALGAHYREAGRWEKAARFLRQAGRQATERCAYREAAQLLEQARVALEHLPESRTTLEDAVDLRFDLRNALLPVGDFSTIMRRLEEAAGFAERLADRSRQVRAAAFLMDQLRMLGEHTRTLHEGRRALPLAERLGDPGLLVLIRTRLGQVHHLRGEYRRAAALFAQNLESLAEVPVGDRLGLLQPPSVHSRYWLVSALGELGAFADAHPVAEECLEIAHQLDQPLALLFALAGAGMFALQQGRLGPAIERLERALDLPRGGGVSPWLSRITGALGYAYALAGQAGRGLPLLVEALDEAAAIGVAGGRALLLAWLAEARLLAGDSRAALDGAAEALVLARRHGERGHQAWALRCRAEAEAGGPPEGLGRAAPSYREALALAGELKMQPLLARSRLGLGLVLAETGQRDAARAELAAAGHLLGDLGMTWWLDRVDLALDRVR